jgi:hypothetical protein
MNWFEVVRPARTAVALSAALLVAACGGGGGGNDNPSQTDGSGGTPQSAQTVSMAGVASKGLLKNAVVKVYALDANGAIGALLASTRTDQTGHYVTPGLTPGAQVYIEVTADAATDMDDEATGRKDLKPSSAFRLRAVKTLSSTPGQDPQQVTPFSEMAVAIALANGGLKPEVIDAANQRVVSYFNYPVLTTEPTFDANNKPTNPAALNLAAVSALAKNNVFTDCKAEKTDVAKVECVVAQLSSKGVGDDDLASKLESAKDDVTYSGKEAVPPVQPQHMPLPVGAVKSGIAEAKALIKNVRSNADKSVADALTQRFQAVTNQANVSTTPVNAEGQKLILTVAEASAALDNPARVLGTPFKGTYSAVDVACTLYSDDAATTPASSYDAVKSLKCILDVDKQYLGGSSSSQGEGSWSQKFLKQEVKIGKTPTAHSYSVQSQLYSQVVTHHYTSPYWGYIAASSSYGYIGTNSQWDETSVPVALSAVNAATTTLSPTATSYSAMTLKGNLAPSSDSNSKIQFNDKVVADLTLTVAASGDLTRVNVNGGVKALIDGKPSAEVIIATGSYLQVRTAVPGDLGAVLADDQSGAAAHLSVATVLTSGASVVGTVEIDLASYGVTKQNGHGKTSFEGVLTQADGTRLFDGKITLTVPVDPVVVQGQDPVVTNGTLQLDGMLAIPSRPDLVVHLTTTTNQSSVHSFTGSYTQQGFASFLIIGHYDDSTGNLIEVTLSTPSGVAATVHPDDTTFNIMKGTDVLGVFTASNGRILYADNTYEQY